MNIINMLTNYTNYLLGRGMSTGTIKIYMGHIRRFKGWIEGTYGSFDPAAVTALDVADYRRYLQNKNRKPATINNALNAISSYFVFAKETGLVETDPGAEVKRLKEQDSAPKWLSRQEIGAFIRAVQKYGSKKEQALIYLLLHTGLRISEAVSLNVTDIVIRERSGYVIVRRGKGDKYREVPLNVTVRNCLTDYLAGVNGQWVFPGR